MGKIVYWITLLLAVILILGSPLIWNPSHEKGLIFWLDANHGVTTNEKGEVIKWESRKR